MSKIYSLLIDGAEFFDRLAILEVKIFEASEDLQTREQLRNDKLALQENINNEIGYDKAREIYCSEFYTNLYNVNFEIFDWVDRAKIPGNVDSQQLRDLNYKRFLSKKQLNEKFFGEMSEIKLGY